MRNKQMPCSKCKNKNICDGIENCIYLFKSNKEVKIQKKKERIKMQKKNFKNIREDLII